MDFSKIKPRAQGLLPVDPIDIFHRTKILDPGINDLWLGQGDALREWHEQRNASDVGLVLNTGAGKTLVGLLIAQSLVNETRGHVIYACSSIQLVEQTAEKAAGYGLDVTTYFERNFSNDLYHRGVAPCVTTYQALFNGRSRFFDDECTAFIFDDAHAAEHLLRDHYTLRIRKRDFPSHYSEIVDLFRDYHWSIGKGTSYTEFVTEDTRALFFVPPFVIQENHHELSRVLVEANLGSCLDTMFAWEHLKDHVDLCCLFLTSTEVTITPPIIPVQTLPYFKEGPRRVYLSATLGAPDSFARTFGRAPNTIIAPETTAGECERMILVPSLVEDVGSDIEITQEILQDRKALVMVPTYARAEKWAGFAEPPERGRVTEAVNDFKNSDDPAKLLLAARYDGVDLPGDTCRIMVIDDLPMGAGPFERYLWEKLGMSNSLRTLVASRIVQSLGRISRGMSDHGVVILTGTKLIQWLMTPRNVSVLPEFLQKQIALAHEVSTSAKGVGDLSWAVDQLLVRDDGWITAYDNFMEHYELVNQYEENSVLVALAEREARFASSMWDRQFDEAVRALSESLDDAFAVSSHTGAWHCLWLGYANALAGDKASAEILYGRAHAAQHNIPPMPPAFVQETGETFSEQISLIARQFVRRAGVSLGRPREMDTALTHLNGTGTSNQVEESLRALGQLLGMASTRPDKEHGTGPDVLWHLEGFPALCIEVKTGKDRDSRYQKREVGQLSDHVQWVRNNTTATDIIPIFIGPLNPTVEAANPPPEFLVVELHQFEQLGEKLVAALNDTLATAVPTTLRTTIKRLFEERGLCWPQCFQTLESHTFRDLASTG